MTYGYNRQGERTTLTEQRGCVHEFDYDKLGRQIHDRVTTLGDGVDDAILRLSTTYEVRGMVQTLSSWNNASVTSGDVVNQCLFQYNDFQQLIADYQEHDGEVDTDTTPVVQYGYADGSANTIRPTTLTYPNGRVLYYGYGTGGGINDAISRIGSLIDDDATTHLIATKIGFETGQNVFTIPFSLSMTKHGGLNFNKAQGVPCGKTEDSDANLVANPLYWPGRTNRGIQEIN